MTDPFLKSAPKPQGGTAQSPQQTDQGGVTRKVKKGSKVSMGTFLIGCFIFGIIVIGLIFAGLYFVFSDPEMLRSLGIDPLTIQRLLYFFAILFFGLLFLFAFIMLILNGYRLSTLKVGKMKYSIGTFVGFILLVFSFGFGYFSIMRIAGMNIELGPTSNFIIDLFLISKNGDKILKTSKQAAIVPSYYEIRLNIDKVRTQIGPSIGGPERLTNFEINCGNGQKLQIPASAVMTQSIGVFPGRCLFLEKKPYPLTLSYSFRDEKTSTIVTNDMDLGELNFQAKIQFGLTDGDWNLKDKKNEILVGEGPVTVKFDPSTLFTDLNIPIPKIKWDYEGDGKNIEESGSAEVRYEYSQDKLYYVNYSLPGYSDVVYAFPLRVLAPTGPQCTIGQRHLTKNQYRFNSNFQSSVEISKYTFYVINEETGKQINKEETKTNNFVYDFVRAGVYKVRMDFETSEGDKGVCFSEIIDTTSGKYRIKFKTSYSYEDSGNYKEYVLTGTDLIIETIPAYIKIDIEEIIPELEFGTVELYVNEKEITTKEPNKYEFEIVDAENREVLFKIIDDQGRESTDKFNIILKQRPLVPILTINPDTGETPLSVQLDASISQKNDPDDEIISFTWDFGDGKVLKKVNEGKVTHEYIFDKETSNGTYTPKVTIYTKKGLVESVESQYPVIVKRATPKATIKIDSHPTQIAKVGEKVRFSLEVDGIVKHIKWDFGNGRTNSCDGRECMLDNPTTYDEPGKYRVKAIIKYDDIPSITVDIMIQIK